MIGTVMSFARAIFGSAIAAQLRESLKRVVLGQAIKFDAQVVKTMKAGRFRMPALRCQEAP